MRFIILFLLLVPAASLAQGFAVSLDADLNGDGLPDQARLTEIPEGGTADLAILLGQPDGSLKQDVVAKALVWVGGEGEKPQLFVDKNGALGVFSIDRRNPRKSWTQSLTIAPHNGVFVLAGFSYDWFDIGTGTIHICKADLLSGRIESGQRAKGVSDVGVSETDVTVVPIDVWVQSFPKECEPLEF